MSDLLDSARALALGTLDHLSEVLALDTEERLKALSLEHLNRTLHVQVHQGIERLERLTKEDPTDKGRWVSLSTDLFDTIWSVRAEFGPNAIPDLYLTARNGEITSREPWL